MTTRLQGRPTSSKANGKKAAQKQLPIEEPEAAIPMGRLLASTEKKTRDSAIKSLSLFLAKSEDELIPSLELSKLWKGIFYCFWMSDKPLVQQALAQELSDLLLAIPGTSRVPVPSLEGEGSSSSSSSATMSARARGGLALMEGFWDAMTREWSGLDKWRINKFYLLIRRFVNAAFRLLIREEWDQGATEHFASLLLKSGGPLCSNDVKVPDSLTYHLTDVYLDELEKALATSALSSEEEDAESSNKSKEGQATSAPVLKVLQPMIDAAGSAHSKTVYEKIVSNVIQPLLQDCLAAEQEAAEEQRPRKKTRRSKGDEEDEEEGISYPNILAASGVTPKQLRKQIYAQLFRVASKEESLPPRRRQLYALWKEEKERLDEDDDEDDEEEV